MKGFFTEEINEKLKEIMEIYDFDIPSDAIAYCVDEVYKRLQTFDFCNNCKEYDQEKHCCHRWSKNIRLTIEDMTKWIPCSDELPEEGKSVIVCSRYGAICIVDLVKGISEETRKKMKNGEIDDPCEELWCLSDGYTMSKRSSLYKEGDEFGNNQKDYAWRNGPYHYSGQEFIAWMPLPEPWRGEE